MGNDTERRVVHIDEPKDEELLRKVAAEWGVKVERSEQRTGIEVLVVLALVGGAAAVAGAVSDYFERRKGGQVIDLRNGKQLASRDQGVVYGLIVIVASDGKVTLDVKEPKGFFLMVVNEVLTAVTSVAEKTAEAVAKAAQAAVGDKAEVTVESAK